MHVGELAEPSGLEGLPQEQVDYLLQLERKLPATVRMIRDIGRCHGAQAAQQATEDLRQTLQAAKERMQRHKS